MAKKLSEVELVAMAIMFEHEGLTDSVDPREEWECLSVEERRQFRSDARAFLRALGKAGG